MMVRKQIYLTEKQNNTIKKMSKRTGLSFADIVRRMLDYYLSNVKIENIIPTNFLVSKKKKQNKE